MNGSFKDYLNKEVKVDDKVIFVAPDYRMFATGKVVKITKCFCMVEYLNTWNYSPAGHLIITKFEHKFVIKI